MFALEVTVVQHGGKRLFDASDRGAAIQTRVRSVLGASFLRLLFQMLEKLSKMMKQKHVLIVVLGFLSSFPVNLRAADHVVYEGDEGPGKGKHILFIASDHEYLSLIHI